MTLYLFQRKLYVTVQGQWLPFPKVYDLSCSGLPPGLLEIKKMRKGHQTSSKSGTFYQNTGCTHVLFVFVFVFSNLLLLFISKSFLPLSTSLFFTTSFCKAANQMSISKVSWEQWSCARSLPCCLLRLWLQTARLSSSCRGCMACRA